MDDELEAGDFSAWLDSMRGALRGERDADVPCDGCTACCRSSQFVHIARSEHDTLAHIPDALLFPAPHRPDELVMGYDANGHCPMLVDDRCSIYAHRPRTCRTFDCRVFAAAGVTLDEPSKSAIDVRVRQWRFSYPTAQDRAAHDRVRARARELIETEPSPLGRAVRAVDG